MGLFKDALPASEPTKRIYERYRRLRQTLSFVLCFGISSHTNNGYNCFHGLEQTYKFARRARDHARIYRAKYSVASIIDIERIKKKKKKSHRGALDQSTSFVSQEVEEREGQFEEAEKAVERSLDA